MNNPNARLIVSGNPTIDEYRTALAECVAEKAADWKAACKSAELASKEITRLRLTDAEREAIERGMCALDGVEDMSAECGRWDAEAAATLRALLDRTK